MISEKGISYIKLLMIFSIVMIIGILIAVYIAGFFKKGTLEDTKTNMLLIQSKVKVIKGDSDINGDAAVLLGKKVSEPDIPEEVKNFLNIGVISQIEYDYYYILNQETLNEMGLEDIKLKKGTYFIVNYTNYEVIYTDGYTNEYNNTYYKLSEIQDLVY